MKCPSCQTDNPPSRKFCRECGAKLLLFCTECGAENLPGDKFCGECGKALGKSQEAVHIDYSAPQSYTPKHLADKILTSKSALEGERKLVTVLFADVANFTAMSENLDPEDVHHIMDGCFRILMDEVHKYEGTINQFTGDGVMALFGAPVALEDHAGRACHAALSIRKSMGEYGERVAKEYGVEFKMRMGLNSGTVIVGAIGDDLRMDYTAEGDATNFASRMESLAQPGTVLVTRNTHRLVKDYFEFRSLGKVEIKGKAEPQDVFELIRAGGAASRIEAAMAKGLTKFVGREKSMAALMEAYEKTKNGSGRVVGVVGEAGVGKSRLLLEFRNSLPREEPTYLEGRCIHYGSAMPYLPILDILRSYFGLAEGEREPLTREKVTDKVLGIDENLADILPPLQDLLSLKVQNEGYLKLEPRQRKEKVFDALRDLIVRGDRERPLVLAIEDLHWVDKTTEEFLDYLIGWMANIKVMLVLLYRPEYTHQWGNRSYFNRIGLDQLTLKSSAELVRAILKGGEAAPELNDLILHRAAGNPFFMEELTHTLLENGSIRKEEDRYVLARKDSELQVPDTVQGIIAARIDRLEDALKRIMQVASVIGREFAFRILQAIVDMREELKTHLLNLQGLEFIYEKSLFPELEYIFKHALTQEVAYNSLLASRRKEIHKRIGRAMEELYSENFEEFYEVLAYHYSKGEDIGNACKYLKLSGKKAARNHALWEAYGFYKDAVELLNRAPETEENKTELIDIILVMRTPMGLLGFPEDYLQFLHQGERLAKELGDVRRLAAIYTGMGQYYGYRGEYLTAIRYTEEAFEEARKAQDIELMAPLGFSFSFSSLGTGQYEKIVNKMPEVIDLLERTGREPDFFTQSMNPYSYICGQCGSALGLLGRFEEGKAYFERAFRNAIRVNDSATLGIVHLGYGMLFYTKGDLESAKDHLEKCIAHSEEARHHLGMAAALCALGHVHSSLGEPEIGRRQTEKALHLYRKGGFEFALSYCHLVMGDIHLDSGDPESAVTSMEEALRLSQKNNEKSYEGMALVGLGRALGKREPLRAAKAEECFLKGLTILDKLKMKPSYAQGLMFLGEFCLNAGEKEKAGENLKQAEMMFRQMGMDYWLGRTRDFLAAV